MSFSSKLVIIGIALVIILGAILAINALSNLSTATVPQTSGVEGVVLAQPHCLPGNSGDPRCTAKPYAASITVTEKDSGRTVEKLKSDANGAFHVALAPGAYFVSVQSSGSVRCAGKEVTVLAGNYSDATITCDSGTP